MERYNYFKTLKKERNFILYRRREERKINCEKLSWGRKKLILVFRTLADISIPNISMCLNI